jgi:hypothetical protein
MNSKITKSINTKETDFKIIVNNAFENMFKSISFLGNDPKASVIFYYSGLELFFKARLMKEHWSFILDKIDTDNINYNQFLKGDFISVGLDKAASRIRNLFNDLDKDYEKHFDKINKTRNKLIHFDSYTVSHEDLSMNAISESWYYLHELLNSKWKNIFIEFEDRIEELNKQLNAHSHLFFSSKKKALITKDKNKYKNNPAYKLIKTHNNHITCNVCKMSYEPDEQISLLRTDYDPNNYILKVSCDICTYGEEIELFDKYLTEKNVHQNIYEELVNLIEVGLCEEVVKSYFQEKVGIINDFAIIADIDEIYNERYFTEEIELIEEKNNHTIIELCKYMDFKIDGYLEKDDNPVTAYFVFIIKIRLFVNENLKNIDKLQFQELYNKITEYNINIEVDTDGF